MTRRWIKSWPITRTGPPFLIWRSTTRRRNSLCSLFMFQRTFDILIVLHERNIYVFFVLHYQLFSSPDFYLTSPKTCSQMNVFGLTLSRLGVLINVGGEGGGEVKTRTTLKAYPAMLSNYTSAWVSFLLYYPNL